MLLENYQARVVEFGSWSYFPVGEVGGSIDDKQVTPMLGTCNMQHSKYKKKIKFNLCYLNLDQIMDAQWI